MHVDNWFFYAITVPAASAGPAAPDGYTCEMWRPELLRLVPMGLPLFPFAVWWLFHMLHVFANRDYAIFIIRHAGKLVHRSVITPRYFRFPFMSAVDLQVGDTWTDPAERGKGLATLALESIIRAPSFCKRTCWYVVEPDNRASIRVVEKAGFTLVGSGNRTRRFGLGVLGEFVLIRFRDQAPGERTANDTVAL
jgi:RimJ/RimL family protein N-acetyltransferase